MKKLYLAGGIIVVLAAVVVLADYYAVFGTTTKSHFDFYELTFKTVDEETGAPIVNVHVRCFQQHNKNACTQKDTGKAGFLSVNIPVTKHITRTWLFEKDVSIQETLDPKVQIMFIHNNYTKLVETIFVQKLPELSGQRIIVPMPRHMLYNNK